MKILLNRSGMTILETIIVLIIGGLIISGIWVSYSQMSANDKMHRTVAAIDKTVAATREFLSTRTTVPTNLSVLIHDQDLMPAEVTFGNLAGNLATYTSPLGHDFYVADANNSTTVFFIRVFFQRRSPECGRLAPLFAGNERLMNERGLVGYNVGTINVGLPTATPLRALTPADTLQACPNANGMNLFFAMRS